ncbi:MAG: glycosyltransferase family 4 protein [Verrucomicrobiota bacterium]|nr:glycosyltransferase family 4 protein [Verrucomicrobiota bacterium]
MEESPLRINLVLGHQVPFPPVRGGGVNNLVWMLAKQFARANKVVAYSPSAPGLAEHEIDSLGIEHFRRGGLPVHPNVWRDNLQALPYSLGMLPLLKPADVTSFHTPFSFLLRYKPHLGVCTHTIHRTPKWILKLHTNLDRIYGGSHAVIEQALKISASAAPKLKAIHNCIDLPEQMPATALNEPLTFLYLGRFARDKGLESLIRGFLEVAPKYPAMRLRTIGPQGADEGAEVDFLAEMQALVRQNPQVSLELPIFDRAKLFAQIEQASVFCLPSLTGETFSMAALEAMANAKALLVSDFGPMREMVEHGRNGYIAKAGDVNAWREAIQFFAQNPHLIPEMGRRSFEKARAEFSSEKIAQEYLEDFRLLIRAKNSRTQQR